MTLSLTYYALKIAEEEIDFKFRTICNMEGKIKLKTDRYYRKRDINLIIQFSNLKKKTP